MRCLPTTSTGNILPSCLPGPRHTIPGSRRVQVGHSQPSDSACPLVIHFGTWGSSGQMRIWDEHKDMWLALKLATQDMFLPDWTGGQSLDIWHTSSENIKCTVEQRTQVSYFSPPPSSYARCLYFVWIKISLYSTGPGTHSAHQVDLQVLPAGIKGVHHHAWRISVHQPGKAG